MTSSKHPAKTPTQAPYGHWESPISPATLTESSVRLDEPSLVGKVAYWLESRPDEGGRNVLMQQPIGGDARELLDASISVRTRAHEYGGGAYLATPDAVFAVFDSDQRIYRIALKNGHSLSPEAITPAGDYRYADFTFDAERQRLIAVREDASGSGEPIASLIAIDLVHKHITTLVCGADFYSTPSLSPDGKQLAWLSWQHPNMPWDGTTCNLAELNEAGAIIQTNTVAGGPDESIFQPQWSPSGQLYFVSDRSGWWNLYCLEEGKTRTVIQLEAEFATPQWVFGMSTYGFLADDKILACYTQQGLWQLGLITRKKTARGYQLHPLRLPLTEINNLHCNAEHLLFAGARANRASALYHLLSQSIGPKAAPPLQILRRSQPELLAAEWFAEPQSISFATDDGDTAHGFYYPPTNPDYSAPAAELPPLLVMCHGGPTAATSSALNYKIQFWTSRGFAVLDVNYRGSTGFGRPYRDALKGNWGVTDVIDVAAGARHLVAEGLAHPQQLLIRGSSAGGYTVLAALTFTDTFAGGASLYGIGDLAALAADTHKFEARYLDSLVGPYPATQAIYQARSPLLHVDQLNCPVIFLQGLKDKVVPPAQAEAMVNALNDKGITTEYVTFANEGHGFRSAEAIAEAFRRELAFYQNVVVAVQ